MNMTLMTLCDWGWGAESHCMTTGLALAHYVALLQNHPILVVPNHNYCKNWCRQWANGADDSNCCLVIKQVSKATSDCLKAGLKNYHTMPPIIEIYRVFVALGILTITRKAFLVQFR